MSEHRLHNVVYARFEAIAAAEKITRVELGALSRELLVYVPESQDIEIVNRLLGVLTPRNRISAIYFFKHFLPWVVEEDNEGVFQRFGKKDKGDKRVARKMELIAEFLKDEANNIWTWADEHIVEELKPVDLSVGVFEAVSKALKGTPATKTKEAGEPVSHSEVIQAVLKAGITAEDLMGVLDSLTAEEQQEEQQPEMAEAA